MIKKIVLEKSGLWNSVFLISKVLVLNQSSISVGFQIVLFSFAKKTTLTRDPLYQENYDGLPKYK